MLVSVAASCFFVLIPGRPLGGVLAEDNQVLSPGDSRLPLIGAIRWGGWFKGSEWADNLDDPRWHDRLPFYARIDQGDVQVLGDRQDVMSREIAFARRAGLSFWAFCYYDEGSPTFDAYNYGLRRYLATPDVAPPAFSLILQGSHLGEPSDWPSFVDRLVTHFGDPRYQRVEPGRPLLFMYDVESVVATFGSDDEARAALDTLRARSLEHGLGAPYIVAQNASAEGPDLGFDAFSAYTAHGFDGERELPYSALMGANAAFWDREWLLGRAVIPLLNLGWDPRPRMDDPIWDSAYGGVQSWYTPPTPDEITAHVRGGIRWVEQHAARDEQRVLLLYAWNEFDEGGVALPTLSEGAARIDAIRRALEPEWTVGTSRQHPRG